MNELVPQLLSLSEVAKALCVSPHTIRSWVRKGRLRPIRICRRLLFHPDEIAGFLAGASKMTGEIDRQIESEARSVFPAR
jgi:excisionase family DNA binding protein